MRFEETCVRGFLLIRFVNGDSPSALHKFGAPIEGGRLFPREVKDFFVPSHEGFKVACPARADLVKVERRRELTRCSKNLDGLRMSSPDTCTRWWHESAVVRRLKELKTRINFSEKPPV